MNVDDAQLLEAIRNQVALLATKNCTGCDGTGIFYGNVCICACVLIPAEPVKDGTLTKEEL